MKRMVSAVLALGLILTLAACGNKEDSVAVTPTTEPVVSEAVAATPVPEPEVTMIEIAADTEWVSEPIIITSTSEYDVIGTLTAGTEAELIAAGTEWHEVKVNGTTGYVKASDVTGVEPLPSPYYIYIEKGSHTINVYEMDENGEYNTLVKQFLTATGLTAGKTPTGTFAIVEKYEWKQFDSAGDKRAYSYSPYVSRFTDGIYMHGPVYEFMDFDSMFGNTYKEIGTNATAGCMRTYTGAAYWIYMNCPLGTTVEVVNGSPKGIETPELIDPIHDRVKGKYYDITDPLREDAVDASSV
ncbi:MAG: L,D-transpeptidase [Eubacteriales bacterium]